jgi:predicted acetyltransferase
MLEDAPAIYERARLRAPGGIALSGMLFTRLFGRESDDADLRRRRFLRYDDEAGTPQGFAVYTATESETDFVESSLDLGHLSAATDHASAALWRTLLEHDLIGHLTARLRPEDDAVHWLVGDQRAIRTRVSDHLWLRVLDPQVALAARSYAGPARLALRVADPAGFAAGRFLLEVDDAGRAEVSQLGDDEDPGFAAVSLDAETLGSLYLGGVPARTLAAAGRLTEERPRSVDALDRAFRSPAAPFLGVWF